MAAELEVDASNSAGQDWEPTAHDAPAYSMSLRVSRLRRNLGAMNHVSGPVLYNLVGEGKNVTFLQALAGAKGWVWASCFPRAVWSGGRSPFHGSTATQANTF